MANVTVDDDVKLSKIISVATDDLILKEKDEVEVLKFAFERNFTRAPSSSGCTTGVKYRINLKNKKRLHILDAYVYDDKSVEVECVGTVY